MEWADELAARVSGPQFVNDSKTPSGTVHVGSLRGPVYGNVDLSAMKSFQIIERLKAQLRVEGFNVLNQVVFGTPGSDVATPATFGIVTTQGNTPRNIQLVLRLTF